MGRESGWEVRESVYIYTVEGLFGCATLGYRHFSSFKTVSVLQYVLTIALVLLFQLLLFLMMVLYGIFSRGDWIGGDRVPSRSLQGVMMVPSRGLDGAFKGS